MSNPLRTPEDYELFLYTLKDAYPEVRRSTVILVRRGASLARVTGEIYFDAGYRLVVRERLVFAGLPAKIDWYGYEVWRNEQKLLWYDPQPHPSDPVLESTHPHHKHIPPDIKHHRVPAPGLSFDEPNLPRIIEEIAGLIETEAAAS